MKTTSKVITIITAILIVALLFLAVITRGGGEGGLAAMAILGGPCIIGILISGIAGVFVSIPLIITDKDKDGYIYLCINSLPLILCLVLFFAR